LVKNAHTKVHPRFNESGKTTITAWIADGQVREGNEGKVYIDYLVSLDLGTAGFE
jgi:hypothetical protein